MTHSLLLNESFWSNNINKENVKYLYRSTHSRDLHEKPAIHAAPTCMFGCGGLKEIDSRVYGIKNALGAEEIAQSAQYAPPKHELCVRSSDSTYRHLA